ncbi:MAG TPA: DUF2254 family protein, partial [Acidimicrobiales bacterium]|nr:DUF2254 family protein [Acidimicrobiales bacterium]
MAHDRTVRQVRRRHLADEARRSLFVLPAGVVLLAALLGEALAEVDDRVEPGSLPGFLETSEESARAILGAIAGGTITAAAVVLSFTLVAVQLASSQYSPRTLGRFLGDRFQQVVMGAVFGTFTYSVVVLREVERADVGPERPVAQVATTGAVVLAILALLAVLASIDHTARSLQVESIAHRVSDLSIAIARERYPPIEDPPAPPEPPPTPPADALTVRAPTTGWVQQLSPEAVASSLPVGSTAVLAVTVGDHVAEDDVVAVVWPPPEDVSGVRRRIHEAVDLGPTRTMQDDVAFGVIQLVDIAARALSPAINDPYTAQEIVLREAPLLRELVTRDLYDRPVEADGRVVHPSPGWGVADYLELAIGSLRWHAREQPRVLETLITVLGTLRDQAV